MIIGAAMIPLLTVQLRPTQKSHNLSVSCWWAGASPEIIEREVVSKIEGVLARMDNVQSMSSNSSHGSGRVSLLFKDGTAMDAMRFEVASQLRALYPKLPEGVSYPMLSLSTGGDVGGDVQVAGYTINTRMSGQEAERYIVDNIMPVISRIEGVNSVHYAGIQPYEYEITVDPDAALAAGLTMGDIASAFNNYFGEATIGNVTYGNAAVGQPDDANIILVKARMSDRTTDFAAIPITNDKGRIVYLGELATVKYRQSLPTSYSRINGLDIIHFSVSGQRNSNIVKLSSEVKAAMAELERSFPTNFAAKINYDAADYINKELQVILLRTLMTVVVLMLFVLAVSRNKAYLLIIFVTLLANIFVAMIFYYLLGLQIHIYSLAGITVSLGIIIDTSIIMVDHYSYYHDRKAFLAILGAVLTTIASLTVVFLLPEQQQLVFGDFSWVIMINLSVSLVISFLFIPAILDRYPLKKPMTAATKRMKKFVSAFNRRYSSFIVWGRRHRWIFIVVLILGFGIPIHKLPAQLKPERDKEPTMWMDIYNKTIGGKFYQENKGVFEKVLGGALRLFHDRKPSSRPDANDEPERVTLTIRAGMVEGNTVHQLNEIVRHMENYLSQFEEIESFRSNVSSFDNSTITVRFKPEYERGSFPYVLFENAKREANRFGGATWSIYGLPELSFNNNVASYSDYKQNRIALTGYNYDNLLRYAEQLRDTLSRNRRVDGPEIYGEVSWNAERRKQEFFVKIDREKLLMTGANLGGYFNRLDQLLYSNQLRPVFVAHKSENVWLNSSQRESFDLWHVRNYTIAVDSVNVKLADFGTVDKELTGLDIYKRNQSYQLIVAFDFIGSWELADRLIKTQVDRLNREVLPIGYVAKNESGGGWWGESGDDWKSFRLILLVMAIIYGVCAILFESLTKPLVIITMIPVSFIGVFLTFGLFKFDFGQGGFASFVLLSGLVVNAGIYVINEYNIISRQCLRRPLLEIYVKAYSRKIVPIILTIVSTVLGLLPFLVGNSDDPFWYSFAVGMMGGMVFSIIAFLVYLPVFLPMRKAKLYNDI